MQQFERKSNKASREINHQALANTWTWDNTMPSFKKE